MMFGLKGQELLIVLLIIVVIFGARKLPGLARSLGSSAKEFRKGIEEGTGEDEPDVQISNPSDPDSSVFDSKPPD